MGILVFELGRGVASHFRIPLYIYTNIYIYTYNIWCLEYKQAQMNRKNLHAI